MPSGQQSIRDDIRTSLGRADLTLITCGGRSPGSPGCTPPSQPSHSFSLRASELNQLVWLFGFWFKKTDEAAVQETTLYSILQSPAQMWIRRQRRWRSASFDTGQTGPSLLTWFDFANSSAVLATTQY